MLCLSTLLFAAICQQPLTSQLPKEDLGVTAFLQKYPEYNGKGIRVAVLDTGVDPGHPFLQKTPNGGRKIVDWYDATTDGRLQIQHRTKAENGTIMGLSGRRLDLGKWAAPGREFGLIRIDQDFLPDDLEGRIQGDRSEDWGDAKRKYQERQARANLNNDEQSTLAAQEEHYFGSYQDVGPVWDMVVFELNGHKVVVVDNDEDGNLGEEPALKNFRQSGDWATLGDEALMNYAVSVEGDNEVHLYFDAHGHGTHVAGIIGAWEGEAGRLNGVAPGVEFVAIKIGDGKFGGSTSGFAISKALDYAVEAGCQVANISFGGPSFFADGLEPDGWVVEEATRRGLCVVTSAGNEGPTLTTVGAPATTSAAFSIAAAVWPGTQRANYSSLTPSDPVLFDFSSRGPLPTGDLGIDYAAPGAALSALPSWGITLGENWNGTSMAAPQISGCIALLHCAAEAEGWAHDPVRIDRALRLSAEPMPNHSWIEQGHGFVSVPAAFDALGHLHQAGFQDQLYTVSVSNPFGVGAGVYLRGVASGRPMDVNVNLTPLFDDETSNATQASFLRTFRPEPEADWIQGPDIFYSSAHGQNFKLRLNCGDLEPGLYSTRVLIYDVDQPRDFGPEVVLPVTVIIPDQTTTGNENRYQNRFALRPGQLNRNFLDVPYGATRAKIKVTQFGGARNEIRSGAGSVSGFLYAGDRQARGRFFLEDGQTYETSVPVEAGTVMEYTMASRWATNLEAEYLLEVQFTGVVAQDSEVVVPAGQNLAYLGLKNTLGSGRFAVSGNVEGIAIPITAQIDIKPDPIRHTVMGKRGLFYGTRAWSTEIPAAGADVVLRMPHSIQTIELREDLMLLVRDANGQTLKRLIAYEIDTPVGHLDAGKYDFELIYPSIGLAALKSAYAGAELRLQTGGGSMSASSGLQEALQGNAGSTLDIPFGGARTAYLATPELEALRDGRYYFGSATVKSGGDTVLSLPLSIHRPWVAPAEAMEEEAPAISVVSLTQQEAANADEDPIAAARAKFEETQSADAASAACLHAAWDWQSADSMNFEAELAVLETLAAANLNDYAQQRGTGFLSRFPSQITVFLDAAAGWNP
ncbi:MAG: S8 family serine peptidase [Planctomycetes bacterium]|nr:S8 family serine peptidase [Planctomycetota bacterium]